MAWDIKDAVGSGPPVVLPNQSRRIGNVQVSYSFLDSGTAFIQTEGGTVDDRWLAYTVCREELAACGIRYATFTFDHNEQGQLFNPNTYQRPKFVDLRDEGEPYNPDYTDEDYEGGYRYGVHDESWPFLHSTARNELIVGPFTWYHIDMLDNYDEDLSDRYLSDVGRRNFGYAGRIFPQAGMGHPANHIVWYTTHPQKEAIEQQLRESLGLGNTQAGADDEFDWHESRVQKTAAWPDIMAKAKRLIQSGNVTLLRNGMNNIVAHVIGDHGEYQCEISRDDPDSRAITQWTCECPWDQYAFQRTRQWKKYEGRPCAHVLAAYWKSLATPVDDQPTGMPPGTPPAGPAVSPGMGQGMGLPPGGGIATPQGWQKDPGSEGMVFTGPGGPGGMPMAPSVYGPQLTPALNPIPQFDAPPTGAPEIPGYNVPTGAPHIPNYRIPLQMNPPAINGPMPGMGMTPLDQFAPPADNNIIPPYPLAEQTLPPPQPVSVPGARPGPYPANPLQQPGTFSKTYKVGKAGDEFPAGSAARVEEATLGQSEGREGAYDAGQWMEIPKNAMVEVVSQDATTGWVEVIYPLKGGPMSSYHVRCFMEPEKLTPLPGSRTPFENPKGRFT